MPRTCVMGCKITEDNKLHVFPKNRERYNIWLDRLCGGEAPQRIELHACRRHFHKRFHFQWGLAKTALPEYHLHPNSSFPQKNADNKQDAKENSKNTNNEVKELKKNSRRVPIMNASTLSNTNAFGEMNENNCKKHESELSLLLPLQNINVQEPENEKHVKCAENVPSMQMLPTIATILPDLVIQDNICQLKSAPALPIATTTVDQTDLNNTTVHSMCETKDIDEQQLVEIVLPEIPVKDLKDGVIIFQKDNMVTMKFLKSQGKDLASEDNVNDNDNNNKMPEEFDQSDDTQIKKTIEKLEKQVAKLQQSVLKISNPRKLIKFTPSKKYKSNGGIRKSYRISRFNGKENKVQKVIKSSNVKIKRLGEKLNEEYMENYESCRSRKTTVKANMKLLDDCTTFNEENDDDISDIIDGEPVSDEDYINNREDEIASTDCGTEEEEEANVSDDNLIKYKPLRFVANKNHRLDAKFNIQANEENNFDNTDCHDDYCKNRDDRLENVPYHEEEIDNNDNRTNDNETTYQEEFRNVFNNGKDNKECKNNFSIRATDLEEVESQNSTNCNTSTIIDIVVLNNNEEKQFKKPNGELPLGVWEEKLDGDNFEINNITNEVFNETDNSVNKVYSVTSSDELSYNANSIDNKYIKLNDEEDVHRPRKYMGKRISLASVDNNYRSSTESNRKVKIKPNRLHTPTISKILRSKIASNNISKQIGRKSCVITPNESKKYFLRTNGSPLKPLLKANLKNKLFAIDNNNNSNSCNKTLSTILTTITEIATPTKHIPSIETHSSSLPSIISTPNLPTILQKIEPLALNNNESAPSSLPPSQPIVMPTPLVFQSPFVQAAEPVALTNDQFVLVDLPQPLQIKLPNQHQEQHFIPDPTNITDNTKYCHSKINKSSNAQQLPIIQKEQNQQNQQNQKPIKQQQSLLKKNWYLHTINEAEIPLQSTCVNVQTDFTFNGICALVDSARFHLNCFYCSEFFPLQFWSQFMEHVQSKHSIKKASDNDENSVLSTLESDHDYTTIKSPPNIKHAPVRRVIIEKEIIIPNDSSFTNGNYNNSGDDAKSEISVDTSRKHKNHLRELSALLQKKYSRIRKQNINSNKAIDLRESYKRINGKTENTIIPINDSNSITDMTSHDIEMPLEWISQKTNYVKQRQQELPVEDYNTNFGFNTAQKDPLNVVVISKENNSAKRRKIVAHDSFNSSPVLAPTYQTYDMLSNDENEDELPDNNSGIGIVFGQTNRAVVIDFLQNLQKFPLLYKHQKDCYQQDYDEAISKMCCLLNEKHNVHITDLELRISIRRVIDWYCYTLDDIQRHNRTNKIKKIIPFPPYPHAFPEFFEICAKFLPNTRVCDNLLLKSMAPLNYKRYNQEIHYPSWVKFLPKPLNNQEQTQNNSEQELNQQIGVKTSSVTTNEPVVSHNKTSKVRPTKKKLTAEERLEKKEKIKQKKAMLAENKARKEAELRNKRKELGNRILRCETCGREFRNRCLYRVHKIHHQPPRFKCDQCDKNYHHNHQLQRHIKAKHNPIPPYVCEFCGVALRSQGTLKIHLDNKHYNVRFPCVVCEYTTYSAAKLAKHQRKWHVALEGTVEELARRRYSLNNTTSLWKNSVKIPGIKNFTCTICHLVFNNLKDVKQHNQRLHPIRSSTYICPLCKPNKMITRSSLRRHFRNIHHIQPKDMKEMMKRSKPVLDKNNRKSESVQEFMIDLNDSKSNFNVLYEELIENDYIEDNSINSMNENDDHIVQEEKQQRQQQRMQKVLCNIIDIKKQDVDELTIPLVHEVSFHNSLNEEHLDPILDVTII